MSNSRPNNPSRSNRNLEEVEVETTDLITDISADPVYYGKAHVLNNAFQRIGMGKYQVGLLFQECTMRVLCICYVVVAIYRSWLWMVFVSNQYVFRV